MASPPSTSAGPPADRPDRPGSTDPSRTPNEAFRRLRGQLSPAEFAAAVRRAARDIGERVSCDARYVGRVESGEIRCPNYAYERVFLHMFPGYSLTDLGFTPREAVRGRVARTRRADGGDDTPPDAAAGAPPDAAPPVAHAGVGRTPPAARTAPRTPPGDAPSPAPTDEESAVLRHAFMTGGPAALATVSVHGPFGAPPASARTASAAPLSSGIPQQVGLRAGRPGRGEAESVAAAVRQIRLLDDRHGADDLYQRAGVTLRSTYELLDAGARRQSVSDQLHSNAGELALSVGWLAHDSERYADARSHYGEALALARVADDPALEAHAFCNTSFLARDAGRPREALRAAQAGQHAARQLGSPRLQSLLALREAGGWSGLGDRTGCEEALSRAHTYFERGDSGAGYEPEWMTFFCRAELAGLESQAWAALGDWRRAAECARQAVALQPAQFLRNRALFTAELAYDLAAAGAVEESAAEAGAAARLLSTVRSRRVRALLARTTRHLTPKPG